MDSDQTITTTQEETDQSNVSLPTVDVEEETVQSKVKPKSKCPPDVTEEECAAMQESESSESSMPPVDAASMLSGVDKINKMRYFNDILALLVICIIVLLCIYVMPEKAVKKMNISAIKSLNSPAIGLPLISFLIIITIVIISLRFSHLHLQQRLQDPCEAHPPVRIDPSNRIYANASFLYMYLVGYIRTILNIAFVMLVLYVAFVCLNSCDIRRDEITFRPEFGWKEERIKTIIVCILIIPALIVAYQYVMWFFIAIVDKFSEWDMDAVPFRAKWITDVCRFIKPSNLLQNGDLFTVSDHVKIFIAGLIFSLVFGLLFVNTAHKESVCKGKKEEKDRYTVFKNRSIFGFLIAIAIVIFMYLGFWVREFAVRMSV